MLLIQIFIIKAFKEDKWISSLYVTKVFCASIMFKMSYISVSHWIIVCKTLVQVWVVCSPHKCSYCRVVKYWELPDMICMWLILVLYSASRLSAFDVMEILTSLQRALSVCLIKCAQELLIRIQLAWFLTHLNVRSLKIQLEHKCPSSYVFSMTV